MESLLFHPIAAHPACHLLKPRRCCFQTKLTKSRWRNGKRCLSFSPSRKSRKKTQFFTDASLIWIWVARETSLIFLPRPLWKSSKASDRTSSGLPCSRNRHEASPTSLSLYLSQWSRRRQGQNQNILTIPASHRSRARQHQAMLPGLSRSNPWQMKTRSNGFQTPCFRTFHSRFLACKKTQINFCYPD